MNKFAEGNPDLINNPDLIRIPFKRSMFNRSNSINTGTKNKNHSSATFG